MLSSSEIPHFEVAKMVLTIKVKGCILSQNWMDFNICLYVCLLIVYIDIGITNGHFIHAGPLKGTGVSIYTLTDLFNCYKMRQKL